MARHTLYAYVQGTDLDEVVERLDARLDEIVAGRAWSAPDVWVVNQRHTPTEWDLGVNVTLPTSPHKNTAWLEDAAALATACAVLHRETGRTFVIGLHDAKTEAVKDVFFVTTDAPDVEALKAALTAALR